MSQEQELQIERAITNPTTTPFTTASVEELLSTRVLTTPNDTPLYNTIKGRAKVSKSMMFEWNESTLSSSYANAKYSNGVISTLTMAGATPTRKQNYLMTIGAVATVSGIVKSLAQVGDIEGDDALATELNDQYQNLVGAIEYYLWNGDHTASSDETNGIASVVTTAVVNGGVVGTPAPIDVNAIDLAMVQMAEAGATPTALYCSHMVAQRIAKFASDRVRYNDTVQAQNGIGQNAFFYSSPFGFTVQVKPLLAKFLPTETAYLLDEKLVTLRYSGDSVEQIKPLGYLNDGSSTLLCAYVGLEVKNASAHRVITEVEEALA